MGTEIPLNYPMALYSKSPHILSPSYMWWSKLYIATQISSKVYKWPNLKSQFCALVRTSWTNLETGVDASVRGISLLVPLLHDHDKKQHEGAICTCIHCHCVLGSAVPPATNLHLDPEPQGRWCWMKIKIPHKIMLLNSSNSSDYYFRGSSIDELSSSTLWATKAPNGCA